ncbi:MAG: CPBP family intramembrane glutamic endopeptidase [Endomicrobiia bacterium]
MTKRSWQFVVLTFILSWSLALGFKIFGGKINSSLGLIVAIIYMLCPLFAVFILEKFVYRQKIKYSCGINFSFNIWFIIAWVLPLVISFASLPVAKMFPGVEIVSSFDGFLERFKNNFSQQQMQQLKQQMQKIEFVPMMFWILQALFFGITINAVFAFGEEIGWRGFLYNELNPKFNFLKISLITGFIWGLWHAPLILQGHNYPNFPKIGVIWMIIFCILYSPIFNFIRKKSNSVIATSILHGTLNATYGFSILFLKGGNELTVGILGLSGFIILLIVDIIIFLSNP